MHITVASPGKGGLEAFLALCHILGLTLCVLVLAKVLGAEEVLVGLYHFDLKNITDSTFPWIIPQTQLCSIIFDYICSLAVNSV